MVPQGRSEAGVDAPHPAPTASLSSVWSCSTRRRGGSRDRPGTDRAPLQRGTATADSGSWARSASGQTTALECLPTQRREQRAGQKLPCVRVCVCVCVRERETSNQSPVCELSLQLRMLGPGLTKQGPSRWCHGLNRLQSTWEMRPWLQNGEKHRSCGPGISTGRILSGTWPAAWPPAAQVPPW